MRASVLQETFHHHWREGNLPSASRCEVCRRSCSSSEAMVGMRCEWCSVTVGFSVKLFILTPSGRRRQSIMQHIDPCVCLDRCPFMDIFPLNKRRPPTRLWSPDTQSGPPAFKHPIIRSFSNTTGSLIFRQRSNVGAHCQSCSHGTIDLRSRTSVPLESVMLKFLHLTCRRTPPVTTACH